VSPNIAVMSLGFVIARFSVWMGEVSLRMNPQIPVPRLGISAPLGKCMIGLGALLTIFAACRCHVVNRAIKAAKSKPIRRWLSPSQWSSLSLQLP
jgi:uncharacterized membrane protein YidH (DUF202 family)